MVQFRRMRSAKHTRMLIGAVPLLATLVAGVAGVWQPAAVGQVLPTYAETAASCGVQALHSPAPNFILSFLGTAPYSGGAAVADFNNDGFQDIYVVTSGVSPDKLYINNGDGTFSDRAQQWGIVDRHMGISVSAADYNNDGLIDLYVTSLGPVSGEPAVGNHKLLRNNGSSFTNVALAAHVNRTTTVLADGFGSAWGDYDLDGDLDLFVTSWLAGTGGNRLFRNNGNGAFSDVTVAAGVFDTAIRGYGARFADMDNDGYPELLVAGDFYSSRYFVNLGNGRFVNRTQASGTGRDANGMGSTIGDFNNDGLFDWYVTSIFTTEPTNGVPGTGNKLYTNLGNHTFADTSVAAGVQAGGWGWGVVATDVDHDGSEDLIETNGFHIENGAGIREWINDPSHLFLNNGDMTFREAGPETGIATHTQQGRAMCAIDFDNDGDQDIYIANYGENSSFYTSRLIDGTVTPQGSRWLRVFLNTAGAPRLAPNGYGSKVHLRTGSRSQHRVISPGSTYIGQSESSAHFGLAAAERADDLRIEWTNGRVTTLHDLPLDRTITVRFCAGDWNGSGVIDPGDVYRFIDEFLAGQADFDGSGGTNSQDFFAFLLAYFTGCSV